jgi:glutathione peroxidase-family protein
MTPKQSTIVGIEVKYTFTFFLKLRNGEIVEVFKSEMEEKKYKIGDMYRYPEETLDF